MLKPGGRMMVSDIVLKAPLPESVLGAVEAYVSCIAGAALKKQYIGAMSAAGFRDVRIVGETVYPIDIGDDSIRNLVDDLPLGVDELRKIASSIVSIKVEARKAR